MTSCNRSKQLYFTLDTIAKSNIKDIHIVLVDDSYNDPIDLELLNNYPFYIDFIQINTENKLWYNPVVNYNIGFQYVKGSKVIIQNGEVCHIGDVLLFVINNVNGDNYYVFDVKASMNFDTNDLIYNHDLSSVELFQKDSLFSTWYQCITYNRNFHFLTACTKKLLIELMDFLMIIL
jgi:hypothetical protein